MNHISSFYFKPNFGIIYAIDIISFISLDEACQFYRSVNLSTMGRGRNVIVFSSKLKTNICLKIFGEKHRVVVLIVEFSCRTAPILSFTSGSVLQLNKL